MRHDGGVSSDENGYATGSPSPPEEAAGPDEPGPPPGPTPPVPPPPEAYTARASIARDKGLPGLYITGGEDPDLPRTVAGERRYVRLLVGMVIAIVLGGFVLGVIGVIVGDLLGV